MLTFESHGGDPALLAMRSVELVNQERTRRGLRRLAEDPTLSRVAAAHSADMANRHFYDHVNRQGQTPADRIMAAGYLAGASAENIARGYTAPPAVVEGWMNSPGHRVNIVNPDFAAIGAGYYPTPNEASGHFWTHLFATPDPSAQRDQSRYPAELVALINQQRATVNCPPLVLPDTLQRAVQAYTGDTARRGRRGFQSGTKRSIQTITRAANYAYRRITAQITLGTDSPTPERVMNALLRTAFRTELLDCAYRHIGVGYAFVRDDEYRHYWLLLLSTPAA